MRNNRLIASAVWLDTPTFAGWVGRVSGWINGDAISSYVGGNPNPNAAGLFPAINAAELYADAIRRERGALSARIVCRLPKGMSR
jgi:hypothetical protein